jgi:two-component system, OmpR family, copper resistance phosphate regulon response regulator CusR
MSRILIAEDEVRISAFIEKGLRSNGFAVTTVRDGPAAIAEVTTGAYDLMVLDIGLPLLDGFAVLGQLRRSGHDLPVIVLTARSNVRDVVAGLDSGADDYMAKPFLYEELLARIRRRLATSGRSSGRAGESPILRYGDLALDPSTRRVLVGDRQVDVSGREFALLDTLLRHAGQVLTREQLLSQVWGYDFEPGSNVVDVYVRYLRQKVGPERIETVRGVGYRLREATPLR